MYSEGLIPVTDVDVRVEGDLTMNTIAIDGPAGCGKSSIVKNLAARLGYNFLDTGAVYRAVTYGCLKDEVNLNNEAECVKVGQAVTLSFDENRVQHVFYKGEDISEFIRSQEINTKISLVFLYLLFFIIY
jgi:cytidylate kinase